MAKIVQIKEKKGKVLREIAKIVSIEEIKTPKLQQEINDMKEALAEQSDGVALAAPQIAISKRIFIVNPTIFMEMEISTENNISNVFINPEIIKKSTDNKLMDEGCLSVRPLYGKVRRSSRATVKALNENGKEFQLEATGLLAQIFQHETDHLNGVLFIDRATEIYELKEHED